MESLLSLLQRECMRRKSREKVLLLIVVVVVFVLLFEKDMRNFSSEDLSAIFGGEVQKVKEEKKLVEKAKSGLYSMFVKESTNSLPGKRKKEEEHHVVRIRSL